MDRIFPSWSLSNSHSDKGRGNSSFSLHTEELDYLPKTFIIIISFLFFPLIHKTDLLQKKNTFLRMDYFISHIPWQGLLCELPPMASVLTQLVTSAAARQRACFLGYNLCLESCTAFLCFSCGITLGPWSPTLGTDVHGHLDFSTHFNKSSTWICVSTVLWALENMSFSEVLWAAILFTH